MCDNTISKIIQIRHSTYIDSIYIFFYMLDIDFITIYPEFIQSWGSTAV